MKKRPTSVTVIAWLLLVGGGISLITYIATFDNPMVLDLMSKRPISIGAQHAMSFYGFTISIVSAVAMLKGHNWARSLYVIWGAIGMVIGLVLNLIIDPMGQELTIISTIIFLIIVFFLYRPKVNEYFSTSEDSKYFVDVETKKCPKCAETIKLEALICRFCRYEFDENEVSEIAARREKAILQEEDKKQKDQRQRGTKLQCEICGNYTMLNWGGPDAVRCKLHMNEELLDSKRKSACQKSQSGAENNVKAGRKGYCEKCGVKVSINYGDAYHTLCNKCMQ